MVCFSSDNMPLTKDSYMERVSLLVFISIAVVIWKGGRAENGIREDKT